VHRWALLSNIPAWNDDNSVGTSSMSIRRQRRIIPVPNIRVVPANPRSYCYLDDRRWIQNGTIFDVPDLSEMLFEGANNTCNAYNHWSWGLGPGSKIDCPYKDRALAKVPQEEMAKRYMARPVIYLSGEFDTIVQDDTCADQMQGATRRERSEWFYKGLGEMFGKDSVTHERHLVESSHDHRLMSQGHAGQQALFR
jgi:hypothetical protein